MAIATNPPTFVEIFPVFCDVYSSGRRIIGGVLCLNDNRIVRDTYLGFIGDLAIIDTQGTADPLYQGLGSRWLLTWWPPAGSALSPLVIPMKAVANQTLSTVLAGQQVQLNIYAKDIWVPIGALGSEVISFCLPSITTTAAPLPPRLPSLDVATGGQLVNIGGAPASPPGVTLPITTAKAGEYILFLSSAVRPYPQSSPVILSVEQTGGGISLTQLDQYLVSSLAGENGPINVAFEIWGAPAPDKLDNATFTVQYDVAVQSAAFGAIAIIDANNASPLNGPIQFTGPPIGSGHIQVEGVDTTRPTLVLGVFTNYINPTFGYYFPDEGSWGNVPTQFNGRFADAAIIRGGSNAGDWNSMIVFYSQFSDPQTDMTVAAFGSPDTYDAPDWIGAAIKIRG